MRAVALIAVGDLPFELGVFGIAKPAVDQPKANAGFPDYDGEPFIRVKVRVFTSDCLQLSRLTEVVPLVYSTCCENRRANRNYL